MNKSRTVAVFGSSQTELDSAEWAEAVSVGARLASAGFVVVTGGYGGTMEAVSMGAARAGGRVVGVTAPSLFPDRVGANPHVQELIEAASLAHRIDVMMGRADATLSLPGSLGTATELLMAWNINHINRRSEHRLFPSAAVGAQWKKVADALVLLIGAEIEAIYWAKNADEGVDWLLGQLEVL
ncbi:MAG: LOG family protein [Acidimicrobiia bacterium]